MVVGWFEHPRGVSGYGGFPIAVRCSYQNLLLRGTKIACRILVFVHSLHTVAALPNTVIDDQRWFQLAKVIIQFPALWFRPFGNPFPIKPQYVRVIFFYQFSELRF